MNKNMRKHVARLVIAVLLISTVAAVIPAAQGASVTGEDRTQDETYGWLHHIELNGDYEDEDDVPDNDVFVGQKNNELTPHFQENVSDAANITDQRIRTTEVKRLTGDDWNSWDPADWEEGTDPFEWTDFEQTTDTGAFTGIEELHTFEFDITNEATPGIYRIPLRLTLTNNTGGPGGSWQDASTITEYIWIELDGNAEVSAGGIDIKPGIEFKQKDVPVQNQATQDLEHVNLTLKVSESALASHGVMIHNPEETSYVDHINDGWTEDFLFRFSAPLDTPTGDYEVDYTLNGTRVGDDVEITEYGTITVTVQRVAELTAEIDQNTVTQGTTKKNITVTFTNTGNLDLERVSVKANTDGNYFFKPYDYYDDGNPASTSEWIDIGDLTQDDSTDVTFVYGMKKELQVGEHKIDFEYEAFFYDEDGEVTGADQSIYAETGTTWDPYNLQATTDEPTDRIEVTENPNYNPLMGGKIGIVKQGSISPVTITDMGYQEVTAEIKNTGEVTYTDVMVTLDTSDTPFSPTSGSGNTVEMKGDPFTLWDGRTEQVKFDVKVNTGFIETSLKNDDPVFKADLMVNGENKDMLETEDMTITSDGEVSGVGANIMVRAPQDNEVKAGESFQLTYTLENIGDAPARNLEVTIMPRAPDVDTTFEKGQEAVYYQQATTPPGAYEETVEPVNQTLTPGETTTVTFNMRPSSDMKKGALYSYDLEVQGDTEEDPNGESWYSGTTIRTEESESTEPAEPSPMLPANLTLLLVAIIAGVFFALGMLLLRKRGGKETSEEPKRTTEEPTSYEEESATYEEEPASEHEWDQGTTEEPEPETGEEDIFAEEEEDMLGPQEEE